MLNNAGDPSGAEQCYCQAIAVAERQNAKLFQLRASISLEDVSGGLFEWFALCWADFKNDRDSWPGQMLI